MAENERSKLRALTDISSIDITLPLDEIMENILNTTCETLNAHSGTMMLLDETTEELRMVASYRLGPDYIEKVYEAANKAGVPISSSPSGTVLKSGNYYLVPNVFEEPLDRPWYDLTREMGFSSQMFMPMKRRSKVIGLLNVYWEKVRQFKDEEINFVAIAASQAASVVQNARLCFRLKENIYELGEYRDHLEEKVKDTYKKLYDSENYLSAIVGSSINGIIVIDEEGRFEFVNDSFLDIIEWPKKEIIGSYFIKIIPEDENEFIFDKWKSVQEGTAGEFETKIKTSNGKIKYIRVTYTLTEIKGIKKVVSVTTDITKNKKLELEIQESEAKYRDLFENANEGIYFHDIEGYFFDVNDAGTNIFGCPKEEIIGTHFSEWFSEESNEIGLAALEKTLSGETVEMPLLLEIIKKEGDSRWLELSGRPILKGNEITGFTGFFKDSTEKIELEQKLKEYHDQLEKSYKEISDAYKVKTEFISNISHELLTPMTSIKGFTELIMDEMIGSINQEQKKSLEAISRNSVRLINLINQLLLGARLENNRMDIQLEKISMNDILMKSVEDIHTQARAKRIAIISNIKPLPEIMGDEERLTEVINNLLANSIKFTPRKGTITIDAFPEADNMRISVSDTGIGIPEDQLPNIFDRFYQVDGSTSRKFGGVGLGLSICRSIIEKHKGSIWAESDGNGSTFHIVLPKNPDLINS